MSIHGKRKLNKPFRTPSASKKFGVYVRNRKTGRVQIVRFGSKRLSIKKNIPSRQRSFMKGLHLSWLKLNDQENS